MPTRTETGWARAGRATALSLAVTALVTAMGAPAYAWGPHPRITAAALEALGPDAPLRRRLGQEADRLPTYSWLGDWRRSLVGREGGGAFLADDYLLFPGSPRHVEHECPDVEATFQPFFRRALQALRTETPDNAARWVGALLHFVEDSGSPPHAFRTSGELHTRMENWLDAGRIRLGDYRPRLLGEPDAEALEGFVRRMDGLIAYSRERGKRARPLAEAGRRDEAEPVILESAMETSRVVADLLHTLGILADLSLAGSASIEGRVASHPAAGAERLPAKVFLEGTDFSTIASGDGAYRLRNLPPGTYRLVATRPGSEPATLAVTLTNDRPVAQDIALEPANPAGNLIRDPHLKLRWLNGRVPDGWHRKPEHGAVSWQSDPVPVKGGADYSLSVRWKPGARGAATVLWDGNPPKTYADGVVVDHYYGPKTASETSRQTEQGTGSWVCRAPDGARYALVVLEGEGPPDVLCEHVSFSASSQLSGTSESGGPAAGDGR